MNEDTQTLKALIDGVDHIARTMENKWGVGRLPLLVSPDTRTKFYVAGEKFNDALEASYSTKIMTRDMLDHVKAKAGVMERAWVALDAEATRKGEQPIDPDVWEVALSDGSILAVVQTNADASKVLRDGRNKNVWTMDEVARAVEAFPDVVRQCKETFGEIMVEPVREKRARAKLDDPIPFG